jgi:hypothetical protein
MAIRMKQPVSDGYRLVSLRTPLKTFGGKGETGSAGKRQEIGKKSACHLYE